MAPLLEDAPDVSKQRFEAIAGWIAAPPEDVMEHD